MNERTALPANTLSYSCYAAQHKEGEQFVRNHVLTHILSGSLRFYTSAGWQEYREGDSIFLKKNQLVKTAKFPPEGGEFRSVSIYFEQDVLREFSLAYNTTADKPCQGMNIVRLPDQDRLSSSFMASLAPYDMLSSRISSELTALKVKEAILILLQLDPALKDLLFDFSEPGKIDLEAYMNQHFTFNVDIQRFAYLTGRSLATFKRDFEKIFHTTPHRWLQQKRLQEAYYLIKEKRKKPSDVYLDVGFEDFSHFSFAFKKAFGMPPSQV